MLAATTDGAVCDRAKGFVEQMKPKTAERGAAQITEAFQAFDPESTGYIKFGDFKNEVLDKSTPPMDADEVHSLSEY